DPVRARLSPPRQGGKACARGCTRGPLLPGGRRDARAPHRGAARAHPAVRRVSQGAGRQARPPREGLCRGREALLLRRAGAERALIMAAQAAAGPVRAALIGATGRMGHAVVRAAPAFPGLRITAAVASATSASLGREAGELAGVGSLGVAIG